MSETNVQVPVGKRPVFYKRKYLIDPGLQSKIILYFVFLSITQASIFYILFRRSVSVINEAILSGNLDSQSAKVLIESVAFSQDSFTEGFMLFTFVVLLYGAFSGLLLSHTIAGPIFAIKRYLSRINGGENPGPLALRKTDYLQEVAKELNTLVQAYRPEVQQEQAANDTSAEAKPGSSEQG
jgi:hypothetical protein